MNPNPTETAKPRTKEVAASTVKSCPQHGANDELLKRLARLAARGDYQAAIDLTNCYLQDERVRNARGVCLLRMGRIDEATRIFRGIVLQPGCTWNRFDCPALYKRNFAVSLLMGNHPAGCLDVLSELGSESSDVSQRIRASITRWQKQLNWFDRIYWYIGQVEPGTPVPIDFVPGEFEWIESAGSPTADATASLAA